MYEPAEDSELIRKHVKDFVKGTVLDMGTGSGILAVETSKTKKVTRVYAVDVDEGSLAYCIKNIQNKKIQFLRSNLFSVFKDERFNGIKFDTILFNAPYLPNDEGIEDLALYGGKEGYELICKFFHQAKDFLKPKGTVLLVFSSFTKQDQLDKFLTKNHWKFKEVDKVHISFEDIILYSVFLG